MTYLGRDIEDILVEVVEIEDVVDDQPGRVGAFGVGEQRTDVAVGVEGLEVVLHVAQVVEILLHVVELVALFEVVEVGQLGGRPRS